jgi:hypothetical protein
MTAADACDGEPPCGPGVAAAPVAAPHRSCGEFPITNYARFRTNRWLGEMLRRSCVIGDCRWRQWGAATGAAATPQGVDVRVEERHDGTARWISRSSRQIDGREKGAGRVVRSAIVASRGGGRPQVPPLQVIVPSVVVGRRKTPHTRAFRNDDREHTRPNRGAGRSGGTCGRPPPKLRRVSDNELRAVQNKSTAGRNVATQLCDRGLALAAVGGGHGCRRYGRRSQSAVTDS